MARAREVAFEIIDDDPGLRRNELLRDELQIFVDPAEAEFLFMS